MPLQKEHYRQIRHKRIRARIKGTAACPRLVVFRSNQHMFAQLIDDSSGHVLAAASDLKTKKGTGVERATAVGTAVADVAKKKNISACVFDRNGYKYHGNVKALAEAARKGGLQF